MVSVERFRNKTKPAPGGCLEWQGGLTNGYGRFSVGGRVVIAARFMYEYCYGPIPTGMAVDKTCRNKKCVAPIHLELVTHRESLRRWRGPQHFTEAGKRNRRLSQLGDRGNNWKGDGVGYTGLHSWIRKRMPKPANCAYFCGSAPHDLANISGEYKRELSDWHWLCRRCHMKEDGRLAKWMERNHGRRKHESPS